MPKEVEEAVVDLELARLIKKAIEQYNKYRSPEAVAKLVSLKGNEVIVEFDGSFCLTCGINDWVEDFKYVLEDMGVEAELVKVIEPDDPFSEENWRIGVFKIKVKK